VKVSRRIISATAFAFSAIAFLAYLALTAPALPARMATHFDWGGQPNDWMSRGDYLLVFGSLGLGVAILIVGLCFALRFVPKWTINIPRRDYWLAPERRTQTFDYLLNWALWFGCLLLAFLTAVHHLVVEANRQIPVVLPSSIGLISLIFVGGVLTWAGFLLVHFGKRRGTDPHLVTGC